MYSQAKTFRQTPAEMLGLNEPWIAWQFDRAVFTLGRYVEWETRPGKDGKPRRRIETVLGQEPREQGTVEHLALVFGGLIDAK